MLKSKAKNFTLHTYACEKPVRMFSRMLSSILVS